MSDLTPEQIVEPDTAELLIRLQEWTGIGKVIEDVILHRDITDAFHSIERLQEQVAALKKRPTIPKYNALQEECDGRMTVIKKLQAQLAALTD